MLTQSQVDALQKLADAAERATAANIERDAAVDAARRAGASWASIAVLLGVTKQGAAKRHNPRVMRRDSQALLF